MVENEIGSLSQCRTKDEDFVVPAHCKRLGLPTAMKQRRICIILMWKLLINYLF